MFSMGIIHIHCYVTLKLLKKDTINPSLNGNGKLASFHCTTALLESNCYRTCGQSFVYLTVYIMYCLELLRDWTTSGHCSHYIMEEVNLFDGKPNSEQRDRLYTILTIIIDTHLAPLARQILTISAFVSCTMSTPWPSGI